MKSLIIYISFHHKNTLKIAEEMALKLEADLCTVSEIDSINFDDYDLIGLGSGIFHGKHHQKLLDLANNQKLKGKRLFVFSTSGTGNKKYNNTLINLLKQNECHVLNDFSCKGYDTYGIFKYIGGISKGHPNQKDMLKVHDFIKTITLS